MSLIDRFLKNSSINAVFLFLICLTVGYVVSCSLPNLFDIKSRVFSIPYRFLMLIFSVYILVEKGSFKKIDFKTGLIFCSFWFFYFLKTVYSFHTDFYLPQIIYEEYEIYIRIVFINLVPCLALLSIDYSKVNFELLIKSIFWILFIMLLINFLYVVLLSNNYNNNSGIFSVYYISSGHFGASLVIFSLFLLLFRSKSEIDIDTRVVVIAMLLGLFAIFLSAARSPILALIIVSLYFLALKKKLKLLIYFFLFLAVSLVLLYISRQFLNLDSAFIERNYLGVFEGYTAGREPFVIRAVSIIQDNIFLGGRVLYEDGLYPHNIFLELLIAGGIFLLVLFGLFFYPLLKNIKHFSKISETNFYILPLFALWIQYFLFSLTSNAIYSNPDFWYFSCIIIGISIKTYNEKT